jgi:hypothetical protein
VLHGSYSTALLVLGQALQRRSLYRFLPWSFPTRTPVLLPSLLPTIYYSTCVAPDLPSDLLCSSDCSVVLVCSPTILGPAAAPSRTNSEIFTARTKRQARQDCALPTQPQTQQKRKHTKHGWMGFHGWASIDCNDGTRGWLSVRIMSTKRVLGGPRTERERERENVWAVSATSSAWLVVTSSYHMLYTVAPKVSTPYYMYVCSVAHGGP